MRRAHGLRALLRIERRHILTHRLRSWLIVALVCVPTTAMVAGSAMVRALQRDAEDQRHGALGLAEVRIESSPAFSIEDALADLPAGSPATEIRSGIVVLERPGQRIHSLGMALGPESLSEGGLASSMLRMERGHAPLHAGQVALSARVLHLLRKSLGEEIDIDGLPATITGEVSHLEQLSLPLALRSADAPMPGASRSLLLGGPGELTREKARGWRARGAELVLRSEAGREDSFEAATVLVCGTFGFFEAALIIGAAFAIGMRRRQRELGLLGSCGAEPERMLRALLLSTAALAVLGSVLGVALGIGLARLVHPRLSAWGDREVGPFDLPWTLVAAAFVLGTLAAVLSAWLPARSATRLPIRVALGSARPIPSGSGRFLRVGAALAASGLALVAAGAFTQGKLSGLAILGGAIVLVLGLGASSPWLLEVLAARAQRLPIPWRLAVRDAGRFRARNGPVITAVLAGMSISVLLGSLTASVGELQRQRAPTLAPGDLVVQGAEAEAAANALQLEFGGQIEPVATSAGDRFLVHTSLALDEAQAERAVEVAALHDRTSVSAAALDRSPGNSALSAVLWLCIATGLVVIFVATSLSSIESAADARILHSVGASPKVLRSHAACRAGYLALLGCVLAVPAGLVPMAGLLRLSGGTLGFVMPWSTIGIAVLAMPLIAYAGTWSVALVRPPRAA